MKGLILSMLLLAAFHLSGQTTHVTTGKPNVFGETKRVIRDASGQVTGSATTAKPKLFAETRTTVRDESGRRSGTGIRTKPNLFRETKTVIRGLRPFNPRRNHPPTHMNHERRLD